MVGDSQLKRRCTCGCDTMVTRRTELRHHQGIAPMHVRASAASVARKLERVARKALGKAKKSTVRKAARVVNKVVSLAKVVSRSLSPNLQQGNTTDFDMLDISAPGPTIADHTAQMDVDELEPDIGVDVIDDIRNGVWSEHRHRVTIEEVPDEDDYGFDHHDADSDSEDDEESICSMPEDDDGPNLEDEMNEEWERQLAEFGVSV